MNQNKKRLSLFFSMVILGVLCLAPLSSLGQTNLSIGENTIAIPDSDKTIILWNEPISSEQSVPYYSICANGIPVRTVQADYVLGMRYEHFDPLVTTPNVPDVLSAGNDIDLYIVQFVTQPLIEYREAITDLGAIVHQYIAQYAYLVEMDDVIKDNVQNLPYVRWIGAYQPAYRLEEYMLDNIQNAQQSYPTHRYNIQVHNQELKSVLAEKIRDFGGLIDKEDGGKVIVIATLTYEQLFAVARMNEVNFIDRWFPMEVDMNVAREIGGANYIETIEGYSGVDVRGESFDTGFNLNHVDFASRPLIEHGGTVPNDSHGTACIGICFGDGTGNPDARGLLPDGQGIVTYYNNIGLNGPARYTHTGELVQDPYYAVFQTASVGDPRTTQYSTISAESDVAIFDFDIILCQSQSNAGDPMSRPQAWAKNIVSGGGIYHYDTLDRSDDMWNYGGSTGPATDGRIKPTLTMFYDNILTTSSSGPTSYTTSFGGTSGATPIIAGHVGLVFEMWDDGIFGNDVSPSGSVFENKCHFTTAKALLVNTAYQYPFNGTSGDKVRMHQGWGMPNLQTLYDYKDNIFIIDETEIIESLEVDTHKVYVQPGAPEMKVTMTYADPPGNPAVQTQHRINDLTLRVVSPSGDEYWGNNGLYEHVWSEIGGSADTKNTVENVFIKDPEPGSWIVEIHADEIIEDSHVETPGIDADYALVATGVETFLVPEPPYGPENGDCGCPYTFSYDIPIELESEDIWVLWSWDDVPPGNWTGPFSPGDTISESHHWDLGGPYDIQIKLTDFDEYDSVWSEPFVFTVLEPQLDISIIDGGIGKLSAFIKNDGPGNATNIQWTMNLDGGFILLGEETTGSIVQINVGDRVEIQSGFIFGLGNTKVIIYAEPQLESASDTREQSAIMFFIYTHIVPGGG